MSIYCSEASPELWSKGTKKSNQKATSIFPDVTQKHTNGGPFTEHTETCTPSLTSLYISLLPTSQHDLPHETSPAHRRPEPVLSALLPFSGLQVSSHLISQELLAFLCKSTNFGACPVISAFILTQSDLGSQSQQHPHHASDHPLLLTRSTARMASRDLEPCPHAAHPDPITEECSRQKQHDTGPKLPIWTPTAPSVKTGTANSVSSESGETCVGTQAPPHPTHH